MVRAAHLLPRPNKHNKLSRSPSRPHNKSRLARGATQGGLKKIMDHPLFDSRHQKGIELRMGDQFWELIQSVVAG